MKMYKYGPATFYLLLLCSGPRLIPKLPGPFPLWIYYKGFDKASPLVLKCKGNLARPIAFWFCFFMNQFLPGRYELASRHQLISTQGRAGRAQTFWLRVSESDHRGTDIEDFETFLSASGMSYNSLLHLSCIPFTTLEACVFKNKIWKVNGT